jgi:hypothetical protein
MGWAALGANGHPLNAFSDSTLRSSDPEPQLKHSPHRFKPMQNAMIQTHASEREWRLSEGALSLKRKAKTQIYRVM